MLALTKIDIASRAALPPDAVATSSVTGEGIESLREAIRKALLTARSTQADMVADTAIRCRQSLTMAAESLARAGDLVCRNEGEELVAAEVRVALDELGKIVGAVYTEDVLDRIFSRFCVGK